MQAVLQIGKYIVQNNHVWNIPLKLISAVLWQIEKRFLKRIRIKTLFNGQRAYLTPHSPSASCLVYADYPDKPALDKLRTLADDNTIFLDIGANIGFYSLLLRDKVKAVYAFEAHPDTVTLLTNNFILNQIDTSFVIPKAVADRKSTVRFSNLKAGSPINTMMSGSDKNECIEVPAISLDEFVREKNFSIQHNYMIKLDVEGAEYLVIEGAIHFLSHFSVNTILFESLSPEDDRVVQLLKKLGYCIEPIMQNNLLALRKALKK